MTETPTEEQTGVIQEMHDAVVEANASTSIYLSGPMSGYEDWNHPLFNDVASRLRKAGFYVFNPAENDEEVIIADAGLKPGDRPGIKSRLAFMRVDLPAVIQSDMVVLLPGWEHSVGANTEVLQANLLGIPVYPYILEGHIIDKQGQGPVTANINKVAAYAGRAAAHAWSNPS